MSFNKKENSENSRLAKAIAIVMSIESHYLNIYSNAGTYFRAIKDMIIAIIRYFEL